MSARAFNLLNIPTASSFAIVELATVADRVAFLTGKLRDSTSDDERATLERQLLVVIGQGTGLLRVVQMELGSVYTTLHLDHDGEELWPGFVRLEDLPRCGCG